MSQNVLRLVERESVDKKKALEAALGQIERAFGKGSIMRLGQREHVDVDVVSTGSLGLDIALGIGGLPRGLVADQTAPLLFVDGLHPAVRAPLQVGAAVHALDVVTRLLLHAGHDVYPSWSW